LHASQGGLDNGPEALLDKMSIQFYFGYPVTQFGGEFNTHMMKFVAQLIEDPGEYCIYISWHRVQADSLEAVQDSIDCSFQAGYLLQNNLEVQTVGIVLGHSALEQAGKTTDRSQGIPDFVSHPQRHFVEYLDPLCEDELVFQMLSGCDVKDKAVNQVDLVVMGNGNCVVNNVSHRLISVDDSILQIETITPSEVTFSEAMDSLLIFWVNVSNPEKVVFLDFLVTVAKCLETIRTDVESTQLVVQAIGN